MSELNKELDRISCDLDALEDICLVTQDVIEQIPDDKERLIDVPLKYQHKWNAVSMVHIIRRELERLKNKVDKLGGGVNKIAA